MLDIKFYFQVHQPYRVLHYTTSSPKKFFDSGLDQIVFDDLSKKCYLPMNTLLLKLINKYSNFNFSFSMSGSFLEQAMMYQPQVIDSFQQLVQTGSVELLSETYFHSLTSINLKEEFIKQINLHKEAMQSIFNYIPKSFRNTELIHHTDIADTVSQLGFQSMLIGGDIYNYKKYGNDHYKRSYIHSYRDQELPLHVKDNLASDKLCFHYVNKSFSTNDYCSFIQKKYKDTEVSINIFVDYETFRENLWKETIIFDFFENFIEIAINKYGFNFSCISNNTYQPIKPQILQRDFYNSWADRDQGISAWLGNQKQLHAYNYLIELYSQNINYLDWQKLSVSDNLYYMYTGNENDKDVHQAFSHFDSADSAYKSFIKALSFIK